MSDDQTACSFTSENIYDLTTNIQVPGTPAGKHLGQVVATATLWTTSDALRAIEDVQALMNDPGNAAALHNLVEGGGSARCGPSAPPGRKRKPPTTPSTPTSSRSIFPPSPGTTTG